MLALFAYRKMFIPVSISLWNTHYGIAYKRLHVFGIRIAEWTYDSK